MWDDCGCKVLVIALFLFATSAGDINDLKMVVPNLQLLHIVHRHGDRTPISLFPKDLYGKDKWPQGLGQLTNEGKRRMYHIGSLLREKYGAFTTSSPLTISVRSSGKDRCLMSAEAVLASFYEPEGNWTWNKNFAWQPIPVQTVPCDEDGMLYPDSTCPKADREQQKILNSPEGQQFMNNHKELFHLLSGYTGWNVPNWTIAEYIYDILYIEKAHNLTLPDWAYPIWDNMSEVADASFYLDNTARLIQRLRSGCLIKDIVQNMKDKIAGRLPSDKKLFLYSSHDTLLAPLLSGLRVFNRLAPPYGSAVIFELHKRDMNNHVIQVLYKNETNRDAYILKLPNCEEYCPVDDFFKAVEDLIPVDWKKECSLHGSASSMVILTIMLGGVAFVLLIIILLLLGTYWRQRHHYQRVSTVLM